ncbi:sporulation protein YabP [Thermoanaerobacterium sp. DL9XJH110]|uniref:sporulation protein YabP n=1 Tax=Thermoanaerobacterium sp. DL9XJH110 TaxID=3386643 RepID=UPI003BB5621A
MEEKAQSRHKLTLQNREILDITGVINVEKFTDDDIILETQQGMLNIKGEKMHMKQLNLDGGLIVVEGLIKSLTYSEGGSSKERGKGILNRLFK